ncbi:MAG: hypothetical protein IT445_20150 [Phycisphaeraceae bacterium]|nr:hypothetical protein [Phycisphaeraceae bacterium]
MTGSIHLNLLLRQWHERKWMVAVLSGTAVVLLTAATMHRDTDMVLGVLQVLLLVLASAGALLIGVQAAAGARESAVMDRLLALPVRRSTVAFYEVCGGLIACVLPVVIAWGWVYVLIGLRLMLTDDTLDAIARQWMMLHGPGKLHHALGMALLVAGIGAAQVGLWTMAIGVYFRTRVAAGAAAMLVWLVMFVVLVLIDELSRRLDLVWLVNLLPLSPIGGISWAEASSFGLWQRGLGQSVALLLLIGWAILVWGRPVRLAGPSRVRTFGYLRPPFVSTSAAMAWKLWREIRWLIAVSIVFALLMALLEGLKSYWYYSQIDIQQMVGTYSELMLGIGFVLAVLLAAAAFAGDLETRTLAFWRSTPIDVTSWYWPRWIVGAAVLLAATHGVPLLVLALAGEGGELIGDPFTCMILPLHLLAFTLSAWMICLLRHAIYGGLLGLCLTLSIASACSIQPKLPLLNIEKFYRAVNSGLVPGGIERILSPVYLQYALPVLFIVIVSAWLGWRSVKSPAALEATRLPWVAAD